MKKKVLYPILCFVLILVVVFGTLYVIDHKRMDNNEPVLFSTWGAKYAPPLESYSAVICSAHSFDGEHLEVTFDDEKHTNKKIAVKDKALIQKLSEIPLERIIGVNLAANIPERTLEEMADYYRVHTTQLLIDYDDFDKYFEIVDISLTDTDNSTNNKNSFVGKVLEETTSYMVVEPIKDKADGDMGEKVKVEYGTDHLDYLYGEGRKVVIYFEGKPEETTDGMKLVKSDDISTEGFREFELEVELSDEKQKKLILSEDTDGFISFGHFSDKNLYYYGLDKVMITIKGFTMPLETALENGRITLDGIIANCNQDVADGKLEELVYKDGGSQVYKS